MPKRDPNQQAAKAVEKLAAPARCAGEDLVFESAAPEHFLARCSRKGVNNSGTCLLERRIGNADITYRFPRDWLNDWKNVASGIDRLAVRLHPN